ncbi:MAG: DUF1385 domain-containing protein [Clostridiales bacterium]|nr:DUF1385 domain-containing protein [Clostridiales bacterium]
MKSSGIGGQAVIEGIMMKNGEQYAVAVRKPDHTIEVKKEMYKGIASKCRLFRLPFIRGIFNFIDSMVLGMSTLTYSSSFFEEEEEEPSALEKKLSAMFGDHLEKIIMGVTVAVSIILAIAIFMVLPVFLVNLLKPLIGNGWFTGLLEGIVRLAIFIAYVTLISRMEDIRRVYMYHGAEHKCINCIEHGLELTVSNVEKSSKQHKRCGTSFMLFVMLISILFFMVIRVDTLWLRMVSRVVLVPVIAGISYEVLRLAGNSDNIIINLLSRPGLWLQNLTTKEPDRDMIEVAIRAVEEVFDWKTYLMTEEKR